MAAKKQKIYKGKGQIMIICMGSIKYRHARSMLHMYMLLFLRLVYNDVINNYPTRLFFGIYFLGNTVLYSKTPKCSIIFFAISV